jgi:TolB-like protein/Tfp pilus assembly protein PilF
MSLYHELKRRNVFRVAIAYLAGSWLLIEIAETIFPLYGFGDTPARIVVTLLAIGFPLFLLFSWVFEFTPEGLKKEKDIDRTASVTHKTGKQLDRIIIVLLALALGYFAFDKFVLEPARVSDLVEETAQQARSDALVESYGDQSIAVLPFINMSDDAGNEYFSDGISEELLNLLAKIPELRVISRSSSFSFKGKDVAIPEVGKRLNVAHILEGSVRKAGNRIRITAQLIDARSDTHLWSETYDRTLDDIFAVQDEISRAVVDELRIRLVGEAPRAQVVDPEAYALVLKARYFFMKWGKENFEKSRVALAKALAIEPEYAEAWSSMSTTYLARVRYGYLDRDQGLALAREANDKALKIDPNLGRAWANLSIIRRANFDWAGAEAATNKSLELAPRNTFILNNAANLYTWLGRHEKALALYMRILSDDPLNLFAHFNSANVLDRMGRLEEAAAGYMRHLELNPEDWGTHSRLAIIYLRQEQPERAMEELTLEPDPEMQAFAKILVLPALGRGEEASQRLDAYITEYAERLPRRIAAIYGWLGNNDEAFKWLNRAVDQGELQISDSIGHPLLAGLHDDPRWPEFLARMGLPY